jgi:Ca2+-binding EF-hand superfamily protein
MQTFDKSRTGTLNRDEVRELCISLTHEVAPNIEVLESDIDMVMRVGGLTIKPEITMEELPVALSSVLALQSENARYHDLFIKYDTDKSGNLPKHQLSNLLTELNEGVAPDEEDLNYILGQFEDFTSTSDSNSHAVNETDLRAAIISWYLFQEEKKEMKSKRELLKMQQMMLVEQIMESFDKSRTGTLSRDEVRELCVSLTHEVAPNIKVLESDIDMVMRVGGDTIKPEITMEELPDALSSVIALQNEDAYFHELFLKHDVDKSGYLPKEQLASLITEVNEGIPPSDDDLNFVLNNFKDSLGSVFDPDAEFSIREEEIRAAIICWYFKAEGSASCGQSSEGSSAAADSTN